jgi:hypothetical protein
MARRTDIQRTTRGTVATVTLEQEQRLRETLSRLGIKSPPLTETSREESLQRLSDFEQEGGE